MSDNWGGEMVTLQLQEVECALREGGHGLQPEVKASEAAVLLALAAFQWRRQAGSV